MNGEEKVGTLSPLNVSGKVIITTDQSTMGKVLGVAASSAEALKKVGALSNPNFVVPEGVIVPEQSTMLEGAVPISVETVGGVILDSRVEPDLPIVEAVETVGGVILDSRVEPDLAARPAMTSRDILLGGSKNVDGVQAAEPRPDLAARPTITSRDALLGGYETVASVQAAEAPVGVVSDDKKELSSRDILLGMTGATQQEPLNEDESSIVLENPVTGENTGLPEPERLDSPVHIEGDQFNIPATIPEDGKEVNDNPSLDPNGLDGGLEIDLPSYTGVEDDGKTKDSNPKDGPEDGIVVEAVPIAPFEKINDDENLEDKLARIVNDFVLGFTSVIEMMKARNAAKKNKATEEVISAVDNSVAEGLRKIQEAVGEPMIAPPTYESTTTAAQEDIRIL